MKHQGVAKKLQTIWHHTKCICIYLKLRETFVHWYVC